jgi:hypothetical protein
MKVSGKGKTQIAQVPMKKVSVVFGGFLYADIRNSSSLEVHLQSRVFGTF